MENPSIVENLEWSIWLLRVFNLQNSGIPGNSGKILTDGGVHYYNILLHKTKPLSNNFLQVLREILQVLDGTMLDVTRAGSIDTECIDTSQIFFVCFGNFDENNANSQKQYLPSKFNHSPTLNSEASSSGDSGNGSGEKQEFALKNESGKSSGICSADQR